MSTADFALYIHWPYCLRRCPYCDFNAHVAKDETRNDKAGEALLQQLLSYRQQDGFADYFENKKISSIFFGGGTPSLMPPQLVEKLLQTAERLYGFADNIEITLEANPGTLEGGSKLKDFKQAGVNRLSMGVQSLYDTPLKELGRIHNSKEAIKIIETLPSLFDRWSFDLIYSRPAQTLDQWLGELQLALSFLPSHLSLYQLTIEPGTDYYRMEKDKKFIMPPDDLSADMFVATRETMAANNLPAYEISNFAKIGEESLHNLTYWHYGDWLGVGAGAEGRLTLPTPPHHPPHHPHNNPDAHNDIMKEAITTTADHLHHNQDGKNGTKKTITATGNRIATKNFRLPDKWAAQVATDNIGIEAITPIEPAAAVTEKIMMGLRLTDGLSLSRPELPNNFMAKWQDLVDEGLAFSATDQRYCLTESGFLRLNSVINYLTTSPSSFT